jgi:hypothetical protein
VTPPFVHPSLRPESFFERLYDRALCLYPDPFRGIYATAMRQSLRDALRDASLPRHKLIPLIFKDLATSLIKEHIFMLRDSVLRPALIFNALVLTGIATGIALAFYAIPQHVLRSGLNDPQIQIATDLAATLDRFGVNDGLQQGALTVSGSGTNIDMARSLAPFAIVYNDAGQPLGSNAQLDGQTPTPPAGVFDNVRSHGEERVTWQPRRGVRIAAIIERVNGKQPGFVLAGRNMREVESRIADVQFMAGLTWLGMLGLIVIGTVAFGIYTRPGVSARLTPQSPTPAKS